MWAFLLATHDNQDFSAEWIRLASLSYASIGSEMRSFYQQKSYCLSCWQFELCVPFRTIINLEWFQFLNTKFSTLVQLLVWVHILIYFHQHGIENIHKMPKHIKRNEKMHLGCWRKRSKSRRSSFIIWWQPFFTLASIGAFWSPNRNWTSIVVSRPQKSDFFSMIFIT